MRIPTSQKYILRVFSHFLALSLFVFISIFVMVNFVQIVIQGALGGFSFYFLFKSVVYLLPNIISMSLPLSFLMAVLLSLGQLSQEGEIVALRAGGFSFTEILAAMLGFSIAASVLLLALNNWLGPETLKRSTDYTLSMINHVTRVELKPRTFQKVSDWVIYSDEVDAESSGLRGVKLIRRVNAQEEPAFVTKINAKEGNYSVLRERGIAIELRDGQFSQTDYKDDNKVIYGDFASYRTLIPFFSGNEASRKLSPREIATTGLLRRLSEKTLDAETQVKYRIEIASRLALALTPLVFFLIGAPLGVVLEKKGRSAGFAISLLIIFFYYGFSITSMVLAKKYFRLFPWVMFAPAAAGAALGLVMWKKRLYAR
ncbi:MAG: LptF/LptG family permease [Elusimicrobiales bacterium]|jgi:lipopolysaccharide export system permease protein